MFGGLILDRHRCSSSIKFNSPGVKPSLRLSMKETLPPFLPLGIAHVDILLRVHKDPNKTGSMLTLLPGAVWNVVVCVAAKNLLHVTVCVSVGVLCGPRIPGRVAVVPMCFMTSQQQAPAPCDCAVTGFYY